mgnify:CR=1 FL=1
MEVLTKQEKRKVRKPLLWIALASIVMIFAGLTSGYMVSRSALQAENRWLEFSLPMQFYWATGAMLLASLCMVWAKQLVKQNKVDQVKIPVGIALLLAILFAVAQYMGWQDLINRGLYFTGSDSHTATSWVYVITFVHWLHVLSGIIVLLVTFINAAKKSYTQEEHLGLDLSAIYWHFLDVLWIYLFCFLVFIR